MPSPTNPLAPVAAPAAPPAVQAVQAVAGLVWAVPLCGLAWFNAVTNGSVDGFTLLIAVVALIPAWVFLGRNFSLSVLGQTISLNLSAQDFNAATGGGAPPPGGPPVVTSPPGAQQFVTSPPGAQPFVASPPGGPPSPSSVVSQVDQALLQPTGNIAVDLRNGIVGRIKALADQKNVPTDSRTLGGILGSLASVGSLSVAEAGALNRLVDVGNRVAAGARLKPDDAERLVKVQPGVIANLERKLGAHG